jgi:hypothetical protein
MCAPHRAVYSGTLQGRRRAQKRLRQPKKMTVRRWKTQLSFTKIGNLISANFKFFRQMHLAPVLWIRDVFPDTGVKKILDLGSASNNSSILTPKNCF